MDGSDPEEYDLPENPHRYGGLEMGGIFVIYDQYDEEAWLQSNMFLEIDECR